MKRTRLSAVLQTRRAIPVRINGKGTTYSRAEKKRRRCAASAAEVSFLKAGFQIDFGAAHWLDRSPWKLLSAAESTTMRRARWSSSPNATKRNGCKDPLAVAQTGVNISAIPRTGPDW